MALKDLGFLTKKQKRDYSNFNLDSEDPALSGILGEQQRSPSGKLNDYIMGLPDYSETPPSVQATIDASKQGSSYGGSGFVPEEAYRQTETPKQSAFGAEDIVGIGVSALGALNADKEAEQERARAEEEKKMLMARQGIADRTQAGQFEEQMQAQERNQNMAGLEFLAGQRANAMKNRTAYSFRNDFSKALRK